MIHRCHTGRPSKPSKQSPQSFTDDQFHRWLRLAGNRLGSSKFSGSPGRKDMSRTHPGGSCKQSALMKAPCNLRTCLCPAVSPPWFAEHISFSHCWPALLRLSLRCPFKAAGLRLGMGRAVPSESRPPKRSCSRIPRQTGNMQDIQDSLVCRLPKYKLNMPEEVEIFGM